MVPGATQDESGWPRPESPLLIDRFGRVATDLRVSLTDRCSLRCAYCMPPEGLPWLPRAELLTDDEIVRLVGVAVGLGVTSIRLTGGEPLLRRNIERLIEMLAKLDVDLTLTTNGALLAKKARSLVDAGLDRVTVSLDSLDDATFRAMNDADFPVAKVIEGIESAAAAGLGPVKVNMVVKRGVNDHALLAMAERWRGTGHIVRFIEYMDVGSTNGWRMDDVVPSAEVVQRIGERWPLEPVEANYAGEVAERWRYRDGAGEIEVGDQTLETRLHHGLHLSLECLGRARGIGEKPRHAVQNPVVGLHFMSFRFALIQRHNSCCRLTAAGSRAS